MKHFHYFVFAFFIILAAQTGRAESHSVVTTLSSLAAITEKIGGDTVKVFSIAPSQFNPHFIEPRPSDVLRLKRADLFIHAGLDLEAWRGPLVDAAGRAEIRTGGARELDVSLGISLLNVPQKAVSRAQGDIHLFGNPHYWMDPNNARIIAIAIGKKLTEIDPGNAEKYGTRLESFLQNLDAKIASWKKEASLLQGQEVLGYHDEWVYLINFLGMRMEQFLEPKPGIPPAPRHLTFLEDYIKQNKIKAIIQPSFYSTTAAESLNRSTSAKVLLLCQNVGELPQCGDYISMIDYDIRLLREALQ